MFSRILVFLATLLIVLGAGWLALRRADLPMDRLEAVYANDDSRFLTLGEARIHFRESGPKDAPAIVLVHGFSASVHTWEAWTADLEKDHRVVSIDLPGHGLSGCIDNSKIGQEQFVSVITEVTDALGIERFVLAGNSMGGGAAWNYALAEPGRLNAVVLVDAAGWPRAETEGEDRPLVFKLLENPLARRVMKDLDMSSLIRSGLQDSFADPSFVTDEMVERYASLARAQCHRDALLTLTSTRDPADAATVEKLAKITVPTLVMHGEKDNLIPAAHGQRFAEAIPGAQLKLYPDVGHLPQEEIAAQSVADLRAFLSTLPSGLTAEIPPAPQP